MELKKILNFNLKHLDCELRNIYPDDISLEYIEGLKNQEKYIENIPHKISFQSQKRYINNILYSKNNIITGFFIKGNLVGTSGIQISNNNEYFHQLKQNIFSIGIFIFDKNKRGMGFGKILVWASLFLHHYCFGSDIYFAGMNIENIPSLRTFLSCGFKINYKNEDLYFVSLKYDNLIQPKNVLNIKIK